MEIDFYNLFCGECVEPGFVKIEAYEVEITLDLKNDMLVFRTACPLCGSEICNFGSRK